MTAAAVTAHVQGLAQADARAADAVVVTAFVVAGAVVLAHRPGHRVALLLWVGGLLWGFGSLPLELAAASLVENPEQPTLALVAVLGLAVRGAGWMLVVVLLALLFPDGHLPSSRWRWALRLAVGALVVFETAVLLAPVPLDYRLAEVRNPIGVPESWRLAADLLALGGLGLVVLSAAMGLVAVVQRWRHGDALVRQQVGSLALAAALTLAGGLGIVTEVSRTAVAFSLAVGGIPVAVGVAVLQHRLYDVQLAVQRTLVHVLLTALVVAVYVLVVGGLGAMLRAGGEGWLPLLAAGVVAVAVQPLREVVQRGVNRLVYGTWDEPADVVTRLGDRLADAAAPDVTLPAVVDTLADTLRLPYVAVLGAHGTTLAERGTAQSDVRDVPLVQHREVVGTLRLAPAGRAPGAADGRLLDALASQLAPVVRALDLSSALQASRERLVLSREEERRRLRRDLHDGLGPALAGLTLRVDTARNTVGQDPLVDGVLLALRDDVQDAVSDVRRVVENLRPPALDELGLVGAVAALARRLAGGAPAVRVSTTGPLPPLAAATEVAAYRIVQEALTNAVRHAAADTVGVQFGADTDRGVLCVTVEDDGAGRPQRASGRGNGLTTMRERAEEIGGALRVADPSRGGTVVAATLPLLPTADPT